MYLKRKIYDRLLEWKSRPGHNTLEVNGARQVGKTYIINKFADENFKDKIYINLFDLSEKRFLECYHRATDWKPGTKRPQNPLQDVFRLYAPSFVDSSDTVIIIDEIQESAEIYNRIREFTRQFQAHFIVASSYPGRVLEPEFRYSSGDVTRIILYTLSFEEFLEAYDENLYTAYLRLPSLQADDGQPEVYDRLKEVYEIYRIIGGYPKVVECYLQERDLMPAQEELTGIVQTFLNDSMRYFKDITDSSIFTNIFLSICRILLCGKKGSEEESVGEELRRLAAKDGFSNLSKVACNRMVNWLYQSGMIAFGAKIVEMDILDFKPGRRCFFMDLGVANYYLNRVGATESPRCDALNENYVFINLLKRQDFPEEIAFEMPAFATYQGGEIDFVVQGIQSHIRYLIEVKSGMRNASTSLLALKNQKADRLLYLKGNIKGRQDGDILTLPIYMLERFRF